MTHFCDQPGKFPGKHRIISAEIFRKIRGNMIAFANGIYSGLNSVLKKIPVILPCFHHNSKICKLRCTFINVKVGMDGYNSETSRKYPKGQPNALIARSLESGSSFAPKRAFIGPAVNRTKGAAEKAIAQKLEEEIKKTMK